MPNSKENVIMFKIKAVTQIELCYGYHAVQNTKRSFVLMPNCTFEILEL